MYNKENPILKVKYDDEELESMNPKYLYLLIKTKVSNQSIKRVSISKNTLRSFLNIVLKDKSIKNPLINAKL